MLRNLNIIFHNTCTLTNAILNVPDVEYVHINQNNYDRKISPKAIINYIYCLTVCTSLPHVQGSNNQSNQWNLIFNGKVSLNQKN